MEDNQHPTPSHPVTPSSQPAGNVYFGPGPNGTAKPMPSRKRLFAIAGAATVLVLATGGYVLGYYIPNKPSNVFKTALLNTADGYDQLVTYASNDQVAKKYQNTQASGSYNLVSSGAATDGTFSIHTDQKNANFSGDLGLGITRLKVDGIVKDVDNSDSPDAYLKVSGIKGLGSLAGVPELDTLDNQWISVDHSLFDNLAQQTQAAQGVDASGNMTTPSEEDIVAAAKAVGEQSRRYLFTTDKDKAVFEINTFVGKEAVDDQNTNHYKVAANKEHLKAFVTELGKSLDKTKLNDWTKKTYNKPLSKLLDIDGMKKSANNLKSGDTFDVWVNTGNKMVHKIRLSDKKDGDKNYVEFGQNFGAGSEKPFFVNVRSNTDDSDVTAALGLSLNTSNNNVKMTLDVNDKAGDSPTKLKVTVNVKPTNGKVDVAAPTGAISLSEALDRIGLGGYLDLLTQSLSQSLSAAEDSAQSADPFAISL